MPIVKDDLERFATKEDLERFVTKEDLADFATRHDVQEALGSIKVMLEEDFYAEAGRLDWVGRRSSRLQRQVSTYISNHLLHRA